MAALLLTDDDDDWLREPPLSELELSDVGAKKKRQRKTVTLDDLLQADDKETVRKLKAKVKRQKLGKVKSGLYASSDEEDAGVCGPKLRERIVDLEKQIAGGGGEEVEPEWGVTIFAAPLEFPSLTCGGVPILQRALHASKEEGRESSLEELVRSGFLRAWTVCTNRCDESTLRWAYHQMAYSSDASLEKSTCKFLCDLVSQVATDRAAPFQMDWLPTLVDVKQTLVVYGYKESSKDGENMDFSNASIVRGPPKNLRSVLDFVATCFVTQNVQPYYTVVDIESLLVIVMHLTLERGLQEIMDKVQDCILALIRYLVPKEWEAVCPRVAECISVLAEGPHNVVYLLGVLSGLGKRSVDLRHRLALHGLTKLAGRKKPLATPREVAALFEKVNLKAKVVDFEKLYYQVVIADAFLWCNEGLKDEIALLTWLNFLGLCSRQIYIGDERPFATRLRNTASFLVQKYEHEDHGIQDIDDFSAPGASLVLRPCCVSDCAL